MAFSKINTSQIWKVIPESFKKVLTQRGTERKLVVVNRYNYKFLKHFPQIPYLV